MENCHAVPSSLANDETEASFEVVHVAQVPVAGIPGPIGDVGAQPLDGALEAGGEGLDGGGLVEDAVRLAGGLLGLALTVLGLIGLRALLSDEVNRLTHLSATDIGLAVSLGVIATVIAGLYPTWRAVQVQPAWQLKAQ